MLLSLSPWAVLGTLVVLAPISYFLVVSSISRDNESMTRLLVEKGAALIRSFEAGARTGMMRMGWRGGQVQRLLVETAQQPDILYLVVTDENGTVVAHSDPGRIGERHQTARPADRMEVQDSVRWSKVGLEGGGSALEVYKRFKPLRGESPGRRPGRNRRMMIPPPEFPDKPEMPSSGNAAGGRWDWCLPYLNQADDNLPAAHYIFVGLDTEALESARADARRHALTMAAWVFLIGFAGMVSLFLAQAYRLTRRTLAKVRAFSDQVVENLPAGLVASDEHGLVAVCNETAASILGRPIADGVGRPALEVLPPEIWRLTDRLRRNEAVIEHDLECNTGKDGRLPLRVSASAIRGEDNAFLGYVFIFRDLTEVRRLQQEVERSRRLASLGSLAAGVAHEIRNPLSSIKGFATYFKERLKDQPVERETAATMIKEVERLDRVIGQLLEFARPSALNVRAVNLSDLIRHSLKLIEADALARAVGITFEVPPGLAGIALDPDRMNQVLLNLYLNSIQAMKEGGTLEVKVSRDEAAGLTRIVVADNGPGIGKEDMERIFDPYFTTKPDGTGLGLAIVHKTMEAHGGEIEVSSTPGVGTIVTLILPDRSVAI